MTATFKKIEWNKGYRELVQGIKGGRRPYNAVYGGNGSYICNNPSELILTVETEDGREISRNIISVVRAVNSWGRITQNRFEMIEAALKNANEFELDEQEYIINLGSYVML